ncbi:MAG: pseudaminic acid synthase [Geopsychrobacter sp.]|nr:pseudaminic acid synthase [Geopsychrobacter sp.]
MDSTIQICGRKIGPQQPPLIVAELSGNHNGSLERALRSLEVIKAMGAEAAKLQTYTADSMTIDCQGDEFQITGGPWDGSSLYQLYQKAHTPYAWHSALFKKAKQLDLIIFSTPFDEEGIELLEELDTPAYKIASFELIDIPLIAAAAKTGKPLLISTGMGSSEEISLAVETARSAGCHELLLLHCTSGYPAPSTEANLATIPDLKARFKVPVGLSDHTLGTKVASAAIAMGACLIEKHFTLSRQEPGPDSSFSLEPEELKQLCNESQYTWQTIGQPNYAPTTSEQQNLPYRRSVYAISDIKAGETLTATNIRRIRPGNGLEPKYYPQLLGLRAKGPIPRGTPLHWNLINQPTKTGP